MIAVPFDTLKMARKLEASGFPVAQAVGAAEAMAEAMTTSDVATKADLQATKTDLERSISLVRSDLLQVRTDLERSISQVRTDLETKIDRVDTKIELLRRDMTIRLGAMLIGSTSIILAALRFMPPHP
jgi:hypothetical protein